MARKKSKKNRVLDYVYWIEELAEYQRDGEKIIHWCEKIKEEYDK